MARSMPRQRCGETFGIGLRAFESGGVDRANGPRNARLTVSCMEALLVSAGVVALAEIGDKTQLLSLLLSAKFRKPLPIILGILVATAANHALAGAVGTWITHALGEHVMRWVLGSSFIAMAAWTLVPDKAPEDETKGARYGAFATTLVAFFLVEMGDKTQVATVALAAQYASFTSVVAGTTLGMMAANIPAVLLGDRATKALPVRAIQIVAAVIFAALGIAVLAGFDQG
jgi:putative Ca2+/H+ antiporter (TMEM165/GDT1 family)